MARLAKKYGKTVISLAGSAEEGCGQEEIDAYFSILQQPAALEEAMEPQTAEKNLSVTAEQAYRLWKAGTHYFSKPCTQSAFKK